MSARDGSAFADCWLEERLELQLDLEIEYLSDCCILASSPAPAPPPEPTRIPRLGSIKSRPAINQVAEAAALPKPLQPAAPWTPSTGRPSECAAVRARTRESSPVWDRPGEEACQGTAVELRVQEDSLATARPPKEAGQGTRSQPKAGWCTAPKTRAQGSSASVRPSRHDSECMAGPIAASLRSRSRARSARLVQRARVDIRDGEAEGLTPRPPSKPAGVRVFTRAPRN
mmetsp:Transcript_98499/g.228372  ORF Transcript_98499/g.228372 Transcript_98499/m.228372 type:complete len:229 (+) Transcript_98499:74-760(+)